jgi:hypothetical protein
LRPTGCVSYERAHSRPTPSALLTFESFVSRFLGWDYIVSKPNVQPFKPKNYAENFVHVPGKLRLARTK